MECTAVSHETPRVPLPIDRFAPEVASSARPPSVGVEMYVTVGRAKGLPLPSSRRSKRGARKTVTNAPARRWQSREPPYSGRRTVDNSHRSGCTARRLAATINGSWSLSPPPSQRPLRRRHHGLAQISRYIVADRKKQSPSSRALGCGPVQLVRLISQQKRRHLPIHGVSGFLRQRVKGR